MSDTNGEVGPPQVPVLYREPDRPAITWAPPSIEQGSVAHQSTDLIKYWHLLRRRWPIILLFTAACSLAAIWIALKAPRVYSSSATVLLSTKQQARISVLETQAGMGPENDINTDLALIRTPPVTSLASQLLANGKVDSVPEAQLPDHTKLSMSSADIGGSISASNLPDTNLVTITAEANSPAKAKAVADAVALAFVIYKLQSAKQADIDTINFLQTELTSARDKLDRAEKELQSYEQKYGITVAAPQTTAPSSGSDAGTLTTNQGAGINVAAELGVAEADLSQSLEQQAVNEQRAADIRQKLAGWSSSLRTQHEGAIRDNAQVQALRQQLLAQEAILNDARAHYTPAGIELWHPGLQASVARLQAQLNQQISNLTAGSSVDLTAQQQMINELQQVQMNLHSGDIRIQDLKRRVARLKAEALAAPAINTVLGRLERQRAIFQQVYGMLLERQKQVEISKSAVQGNASIVNYASLPGAPIRPNRKRDLDIGIFFGLVLGGGMAWLLEFLDNSVRTWTDVRDKVGLPLLGVIPTAAIAPRTMWQESNRSIVAEAFRMLRSNVGFVNVDAPVKVILVTSAGPGEGKSSTVANLASAMAQAGRRVVVVDADMRKPSQYRLLGGGRQNGLAEFLSGSISLEEALRPSDIENVWTIPVDKLPPNPAELLSSQRMRDLITQLRELYDVVFLDTPPTLMVTDACLLTSAADATIQVVSSGKTSQQAAVRTRQALTAAHGRVVGVVLNRMDERDDSSYYSYYYYYGGYYGQGEKRNLIQKLLGKKAS